MLALCLCASVPSDSIARPPLSLEVFIPDAAAEAFLPVAVFLLQLYERLAIPGVLHRQPAFLPHPYYVVILSLQFLQEIEGAVAVFLLAPVPAVGKEDGNYGVDDEQVQRERGEMLLVADARAAEGIMGFPILRNAG